MYHMFTILTYLLFTFNFNNSDAKSWDIAASIGQKVHFFLTSNWTIVKTITNLSARELSGVAYDEISHKIYISDLYNDGAIYYRDLHSNATGTHLLLQNENNSKISTMIYDSTSESLIWLDIKRKSIFKLNVNTSKALTTELILNISNENPRSFSMDLCNRKLYWTNTDFYNSSISSINFDGSNRTVIVKKGLYDPVAITVDHTSGKLYWIDDEEGISSKIEYSNLDGSNREMLVRFRHQIPYHIAVDKNRVYYIDWVDNAIWYVNKNTTFGDWPQMWYSFRLTNLQSYLKSLITRDNIDPVDCLSLDSSVINTSDVDDDDNDDNNNLNNSTLLINPNNKLVASYLIAMDEKMSSDQFKLCLNNGIYIETNGTCQCGLGYAGEYCENSLCHNYCFNGVCLINKKNEPYCKCNIKYKGLRCEKNMCSGYCLKSNQCYIKNGRPACKCKNSQGPRCELPYIDDKCMVICNKQFPIFNLMNKTSTRCPKINATCSEINETQEYIYNCELQDALIATLSFIIFIFMMIIIALGYLANMLRQRPRIKKRFFVKNNGIKPLKIVSPESKDSCEIMIENCCNMSICETPCLECKTEKSGNEISTISMEKNNPWMKLETPIF